MAGLAGTQTIHDQHGQPVWGVPMRVGLRGSSPFDANTFHEQHVDRAGHIDVEYAARGFCEKTGKPFSSTLFTVHLNFNEGFNPDWQAYAQRSVDLDSGPSVSTPIVLTKTGTQPGPPPTGLTEIRCPHDGSYRGYGTTAEWKVLAHQLAPAGIMEPDEQHGGTGAQPNLVAFDARLRAVSVPSGFSPCQLQFSSGGQRKPRLHLPVSPQVNVPDCGMYSRVVDIGSFGRPFFHSSDGHIDVWQLTGRPPSSQW